MKSFRISVFSLNFFTQPFFRHYLARYLGYDGSVGIASAYQQVDCGFESRLRQFFLTRRKMSRSLAGVLLFVCLFALVFFFVSDRGQDRLRQSAQTVWAAAGGALAGQDGHQSGGVPTHPQRQFEQQWRHRVQS